MLPMMRLRRMLGVEVAHRVFQKVREDLEHALEFGAFWLSDVDELEKIRYWSHLNAIEQRVDADI